MTDADVIVVGAGPAGSTVSRELAARGRTVLMLDRAGFPRDKPCGGGVSVGGAALLPFAVGSVVERVVSGIILGDPRTGVIERDFGEPFLYMTERQRLDELLVEHATAAGVRFSDGEFVLHVVERADGTFEVIARGLDGVETHHVSRVLIGADGVNGVVRRALSFAPPEETAVALEGRLPCPTGVPRWLADRIAISPGLVPGGYGWLFPKGDHINIGVGGWKPAGPMLHDALEAYMRSYDWAIADLDSVQGHLLPLRTRRVRLVKGGSALVGDAAAFVDPVTGGGIINAIASASMLAPAVDAYLGDSQHDLLRYQESVERQMYPALEHSRALAELFYLAPTAFLALARRSEPVVAAASEAIARGWSTDAESPIESMLWLVMAARGDVAHRTSVWRYGAR